MSDDEHQLVASYSYGGEGQPTERDFAEAYILPALETAGFHGVELLRAHGSSGDEVCDFAFEWRPWLLDGTILTIGNAPNTIQGAGQLRDAARRARSSFDENGGQLFMMGDSFPVARHGEDKSTHQNPLSGIGQIARNAVFLVKAIVA